MSTATEQKRTYEMKFVCLNCGHNFSQEIPYGRKVVEQGGANKICWIGEDMRAPLVVCPNCGVSEVRKNIEWR